MWPGATDELLRAFEKRTGWPLPAEWAEFLRLTNGSQAGYGGIFGIRPDLPHLDMEQRLTWMREAHRSNFDCEHWADINRWLPIAGDGCGDDYFIPINPEPGGVHAIYFRDQAWLERLEYVVASGPWQFVSMMLKADSGEISWPFDKETVLRLDPGIVRATLAPLPWDADEFWSRQDRPINP
jgi:cell wall assembly regulator SMI1